MAVLPANAPVFCGQDVHTEAEVAASTAEYLLSAQLVHTVELLAPIVSEYVPAGHDMHTPPTCEYLPTVQSLHNPVLGSYDNPAWQAGMLQFVEDVLPTGDVCNAGHSAQV